MTDIARLEASLRSHEGVRDKPYICPAGKLTIGIGRNIEDRPFTGTDLRDMFNAREIEIRLTPAGIQRLLDADMALHLTFCRSLIPGWQEIDDVRQTVLCEMCFQLGPTRLMGFKQMMKAIEGRDWTQAAAEALDSKWAKNDTPERARYLASILKTGQWPE
jgi:lysozyme